MRSISKKGKKSFLYDQIENWILHVWRDESYKNFNDLHIDEIDPIFSLKANWLCGGIACLNIAIRIRDLGKIPLIVMLAISLKTKRIPIGINFQTPLELQKEFDDSPPSIYLLEKNPYNSKQKLKLSFLPDYTESYYVEAVDKNVDPDYRRSIIILSEPQAKKNKIVHEFGLTRQSSIMRRR